MNCSKINTLAVQLLSDLLDCSSFRLKFVRFSGTKTLSGSIATMDMCVRHFRLASGLLPNNHVLYYYLIYSEICPPSLLSWFQAVKSKKLWKLLPSIRLRLWESATGREGWITV